MWPLLTTVLQPPVWITDLLALALSSPLLEYASGNGSLARMYSYLMLRSLRIYFLCGSSLGLLSYEDTLSANIFVNLNFFGVDLLTAWHAWIERVLNGLASFPGHRQRARLAY